MGLTQEDDFFGNFDADPEDAIEIARIAGVRDETGETVSGDGEVSTDEASDGPDAPGVPEDESGDVPDEESEPADDGGTGSGSAPDGGTGNVDGASVIGDPRSPDVTATLAGNSVVGSSPAVYQGSRDTQVCDKGGLAAEIQRPRKPQAAEAWRSVIGVEANQVDDYLDTMTAVRLGYDTRVTSVAFSEGEVTRTQAILQAGTAVLVDENGVPTIKCAGGAPSLARLRSTMAMKSRNTARRSTPKPWWRTRIAPGTPSAPRK